MVDVGETKRVRKFTLAGAAAAAAAALTVGVAAPRMPEADADIAAVTTGPLFGLLDAVGVDVQELLPEEVQAILDGLGVEIDNIPSNAIVINNAINDVGLGYDPLVPGSRLFPIART
ncbi:hypothetical protein [Mycobacterium hubeiense]|uniref:hypothetical protein n=1 Tax=Mycobacterium hubeiense TaxID=1867256 RepID=UPI00115B5C19|nr:hypothetical protein [Mycobacterium sp. QGD 101]